MNDTDFDLDNRQANATPVVGAEAATLVPVVAEADGEFSTDVHDGEHVTDGEVVGYIQTDEDA